MSRRREVQQRLAALDEIGGIMGAMKNLALLETHRLAGYFDTQRRAVRSIEAAAADFLDFHPQAALSAKCQPQGLLVVIGSERGLCGDFNETLLAPLAAERQSGNTLVVAVGGKLAAKLESGTGIPAAGQSDSRVAACLEGPSVGEEVPEMLARLARALGDIRQQHPDQASRISVLYHDGEGGKPRLRQLLPLAGPAGRPAHTIAPLLNLEPGRFFSLLAEQYLFAVLHEVFYASLMAENRMRLEHMDSAIRRIEKDEARLRLSYNALRQEEIIEEIEIIMLSAEALSDSV